MGGMHRDRRRFLRRLYRDTLKKLGTECSGMTAVEYGIMVAAIGAAIVGIVFLIGDDLAALFNAITEKFRAKM